MKRLFYGVAYFLAFAPVWVPAQEFVIDFEGLPEGTMVIDQFAGITVSGGFIVTDPVVTSSGSYVVDSDGENSLAAGTEGTADAMGPIDILFDFDVENVGFKQSNFEGTLTVQSFDRDDNLIAEESLFTGGVVELQRTLSATAIRRLSVYYLPATSLCCFVIDDLSFDRSFIEVPIDIKPGSELNSINLGSNGNVPVAILSTPEFDATSVDPTSVTLEGAAVELRGKNSVMAGLEDVNADGFVDLVVHIDTSALELSETATEAVLEAVTFDQFFVRGSDTIRIVP